MHHGEKSGSSLKGRHLEIGILPMNWKVPNQKVEMGRTCSPIWDRKRNPAHRCGKNTWNFPACSSPNPKKQSADYTCLQLSPDRWAAIDRPLGRVCLLKFSKYFKATLGFVHEFWGRDYQKEFWGKMDMVPGIIHVLGHWGGGSGHRKRKAKGRLWRVELHTQTPSVQLRDIWRKFYA